MRYISNESSGKQGYEIALAFKKLGIRTTLISGPTSLNYSKDLNVKVSTADEMLHSVKKHLPVDIAVCTAAVSDFKPLKKNKNKIKKHKDNLNLIKLEKNKDILDFLGKNNKLKTKISCRFFCRVRKFD